MLSSLSLFGFNWFNDRERHLNRSYVDDLTLIQERMSSFDRWSIGLFIGGGLTTLLGYAWPLLTSSKGEPPVNHQSSQRASSQYFEKR